MSQELPKVQELATRISRDISPKGVSGKIIVGEFVQAVLEDKVRFVFTEAAPTVRMREGQEGQAVIFLPQGEQGMHQFRQGASEIIPEALAIVRRLPGPRLEEVNSLRQIFERELS